MTAGNIAFLGLVVFTFLSFGGLLAFATYTDGGGRKRATRARQRNTGSIEGEQAARAGTHSASTAI